MLYFPCVASCCTLVFLCCTRVFSCCLVFYRVIFILCRVKLVSSRVMSCLLMQFSELDHGLSFQTLLKHDHLILYHFTSNLIILSVSNLIIHYIILLLHQITIVAFQFLYHISTVFSLDYSMFNIIFYQRAVCPIYF